MPGHENVDTGRHTEADNGLSTQRNAETAADNFRSCVWSSINEDNTVRTLGFESKDGLPSDETRVIHFNAEGNKITQTDFFVKDKEGRGQEYSMWELSGSKNDRQLYSIHLDGNGKLSDFKVDAEEYNRAAPIFEKIQNDFEHLPKCKPVKD